MNLSFASTFFSVVAATALSLCFGSATAQTATGTPTASPGFGCPAGYQWSVNTPIPSCVPSLGGTAAAIPCNGGQVSWSGAPGVTCGASVSAALDGVAKTVSSSNGSSGNATFTCTNGAWVKTGSSSCTAAPCAAGTKSWTVGGQTCSGTIATTAAGSTSAVASTGANTGSANYTCSATGTWGAANPGATCAAANCGALYVAWFSADNANKCLGYTQATPPGGTSTAIDDIYPTMGSANFQCAAGGVWGVLPGAVCAKSDGQCPAMASATWTNPNFSEFTCTSGPLPTGSPGQQVTLTDSVAPLTGSAQYTCVGGAWTAGSRTCSSQPAPSANCPATTLSWTVAGNACNAAAGSAANGAIAVLSDTVSPTTGSAYASCNNGSWGAPYNATCSGAATPPTPPSPPTPTSCPSGTFTWVAGANTCSGHANSTPAGSTVTLTDMTSPSTGSAYVTCSVTGWGTPYSGSCNNEFMAPPAPAGCAAQDGVLAGAGRGGIRYLMKPALNGFSTVINMHAPYVYYVASQLSGPGALYAPQGDGSAPPLYCSGTATAACIGGSWSVTPSRTPGAVPQCGSTGGF